MHHQVPREIHKILTKENYQHEDLKAKVMELEQEVKNPRKKAVAAHIPNSTPNYDPAHLKRVITHPEDARIGAQRNHEEVNGRSSSTDTLSTSLTDNRIEATVAPLSP